jgi:hypothetical protein
MKVQMSQFTFWSFWTLGLFFVASVLPQASWALESPKAQEPNTIQRFYFAAAAFEGGPTRARLRYSQTDAERLGRVLRELGGTELSRQKLLVEPSPAEFQAGLSELAALMKTQKESSQNLGAVQGASQKSGVRQEVIVYYSGHADEQGLLLRGGRLTWKELRQAVQELPADVRLSVLDACGSGAIIRTKGGVRRQAFLTDKDENLRGTAFLTSSSESEVSQESDLLRASFFTHAFTSGLRGGADFNGDRKVTLSEAYQYAFQQTLQSTQAAQAGQQHPLRDMDLSGSGDLVLTDLDHSTTGLVLGAQLEGQFSIYDSSQHLIAGVQKSGGRPLELSLEPGFYQLRTGGDLASRSYPLQLGLGEQRVVDSAALMRLTWEPAPQISAPGVASFQAYWTGPSLPRQQSQALCNAQSAHLKTLPSELIGDAFYLKHPKHTRGTQLSLGLNVLDSSSGGLQLAVLGANLAESGYRGVQASMLFNFSGSCFEGVQASNVLNQAQYVEGAQFGMGNIAQGIEGVQIGTFNFVRQDLHGVQIGAVNFAHVDSGAKGPEWNENLQLGTVNAGRYIGVQGAVVNLAQESEVQGGVVNLAENAEVQLGVVNVLKNSDVQVGVVNLAVQAKAQVGILNLAKQSPVQVGLLNMAKKARVQVGLVNLADTVEIPVGLINLSRNGIIEYTQYLDETGQSIRGLRSGTSIFYTHLLVSDHLGWNESFWQFQSEVAGEGGVPGFGIGTRFGIEKSWWPQLEYRVLAYLNRRDTVGENEEWEDYLKRVGANDLQTLSLDLGWNPVRWVGLSAGLSLNSLATYGNDYLVQPKGRYEFTFDNRSYRIWPGIHAELRVGFAGKGQWF